MMRGAEPLVIDIFVATLAGVGLHKKLAGNFLLAVNLRRAGEECALGAVAFSIHVARGHDGILNAVTRLPAFANVVRAESNSRQRRETECGPRHRQAQAGTARLSFAQPSS